MGNSNEYFDEKYVEAQGTSISVKDTKAKVVKPERETPGDFASELEVGRYGVGKPVRRIIRAKLIDD